MQPAKTEEEYGLIDQLCKAVEESLQIVSDEDVMRQIAQVKPEIEEYTDVRDWYTPLLDRLIAERRKTPKEERLKLFRNDSIDEVDTTDLENWTVRGMEDEGSSMWKREPSPIHRINKKIAQEADFRHDIEQELKYIENPRNRGKDDPNWNESA